jgi:hypothetical protein
MFSGFGKKVAFVATNPIILTCAATGIFTGCMVGKPHLWTHSSIFVPPSMKYIQEAEDEERDAKEKRGIH